LQPKAMRVTELDLTAFMETVQVSLRLTIKWRECLHTTQGIAKYGC
jgi:hypothetical protein